MKTTEEVTTAKRLRDYQEARRRWVSAGLRDDGTARSAMDAALKAFEENLETDADTIFIRDGDDVWVVEYSRDRLGGAGTPDSSYPTVSHIYDLAL